MKSLDVAGIRAVLDRLESDGLIPSHATIASAGYGGRTEHIIALTVAERFSPKRKHELESLIRDALPDDAKQVPINIEWRA